jgi:hypothetical protein
MQWRLEAGCRPLVQQVAEATASRACVLVQGRRMRKRKTGKKKGGWLGQGAGPNWRYGPREGKQKVGWGGFGLIQKFGFVLFTIFSELWFELNSDRV